MPSLSLALLRTQSDARLVALAAEGHERAFEAIVERYRRPLLRAARRVLPEGRAEDALQQAFLNAWTALQQGDEVRDLRAWLYRIVHNCTLNAHRTAGYDYEELHDALRMAEGPGEQLERRAVIRHTLASVAALPERQREALLRAVIAGDDHAAVARDLGLSENAFRQLLHRARASVRGAATAITPLPAIHWLVQAGPGRGTVTERIAELTAGAVPVGVSVTLAKAGTVVVVAGGALTGSAAIDRVERPSRAGGGLEAQAASPRAATRREPESADGPPRTRSDGQEIRRPAEDDPVPRSRPRPVRDGDTTDDRGHGGRGRTGGDRPQPRRDEEERDRSGPGGGGDETELEAEDDDSGPGGSDDDDRSGPGSGSPGRSSGPGSGSEPDEVEPDDRSGSNSGSGSGEDLADPDDDEPLPDYPARE